MKGGDPLLRSLAPFRSGTVSPERSLLTEVENLGDNLGAVDGMNAAIGARRVKRRWNLI